MKNLGRCFSLFFIAALLTSLGSFTVGKYAIPDINPAGIVVVALSSEVSGGVIERIGELKFSWMDKREPWAL